MIFIHNNNETLIIQNYVLRKNLHTQYTIICVKMGAQREIFRKQNMYAMHNAAAEQSHTYKKKTVPFPKELKQRNNLIWSADLIRQMTARQQKINKLNGKLNPGPDTQQTVTIK